VKQRQQEQLFVVAVTTAREAIAAAVVTADIRQTGKA